MNFYFEAAKNLDRLDAKQGSIKSVVGSVQEKTRKRTAALVIETLKYKAVLAEVIGVSKIMEEERKQLTSLNLALVLVHDLLLSGGIQAGDGPVKQAVLRHKTRLRSELQKIKIKRGVKSHVELAQGADSGAGRIPRYVRVNTTVWSTEDAIQSFVTRGFRLSNPFDHSTRGFARDDHIPSLLAFHPQARLIDEPAYQTGKVILQDKASCFPAVILAPPATENSLVIDATAAPGNKTSHLSALMHNKGKLLAFERDRKRFATLKTMITKAHCENVDLVNADFLNTDPMDPKYSGVTHILLDPSCSGSGIVNRLDSLLEGGGSKEEHANQEARLRKLAGFQVLMVRHAMKFPAARKIVYSTCSIHAIENEHVVRDALKSPEGLKARFHLAPRSEVLPTWPRRGFQSEMDSDSHSTSLIRCCPDEDRTNGFFVACFLRREETPILEHKRAFPVGDGPPENRPKKRRKRKRGGDRAD